MRAMTNGALSRFNPAQPGAQGMKVVGTGLLVVMAAVFAITRAFEPAYPSLGYIKSFAEAAMVGGLADWFAVTALFRHPLGVPIPHTAIIPRNKDRIGEALASFIRDNFLIPSVVARRMQRLDVAGAAGRFLQTPAGEGTRIRAGASRLIADVFESLDDERLGGIVKGAISSRLRKTEISPLLGHALASAINEDRHVPMLEAAIRRAARKPVAVLGGKLGEIWQSRGGTLEKAPRLRPAINQFPRRAVVGMAASYGGQIVRLVSDTIRGWDARTVTGRLEAAVGR